MKNLTAMGMIISTFTISSIIDPEYVAAMILERVTIDDVVVIKEREHKAIHGSKIVVQSNKNKIRKKTVSTEEWLEGKKKLRYKGPSYRVKASIQNL